MLTHANIAWQTAAMARRIEQPMTGWRQISYLPMAHIGERMMGHYLAIRGGTDVTCCPDPAAVARDADRGAPADLLGMPRMWEKLHAQLLSHAARNPEDCERERLLAVVGLERGQIMLTSGGVLATEIHAFFRDLGLPLSDIYGMSESTGPICWSPHDPLPGCVGRPMPGCEVRLEADGEIVIRGGSRLRRLPRGPRAHRRDRRRRRLAPHRRRRRPRPLRAAADRRPQEGDHDHRRRQEHLARPTSRRR